MGNKNPSFKPDTMDKHYTYDEIEDIAKYLQDRISIKPRIGIICGSGLGSLGETLTKTKAFNYSDIPNFPNSTVIGHAGRLLFGYIGDAPVICMQGRFHYYEGHSLSRCVMPIRLMKLLGVTHLIVSNAAGSVNPSYKVGNIMLIKDHVNFVGLVGIHPLRGFNDERWGPRFVAMNKAYDPQIIKDAKDVADKLGLEGVQEGVYAAVGGPNYETVAEIKLMRTLEIDAVGMSTVHEIMAARHCGITCFAFSMITNEGVAVYETEEKPDGEHIVNVATQKEDVLKHFVENLVKVIADTRF